MPVRRVVLLVDQVRDAEPRGPVRGHVRDRVAVAGDVRVRVQVEGEARVGARRRVVRVQQLLRLRRVLAVAHARPVLPLAPRLGLRDRVRDVDFVVGGSRH